MSDPLAARILSYLDDSEIELRPDEPDAESRGNTWAYSLPVDGFDVGAVAASFEHIVRQLSKRQHRNGTFYCWYEQAGQLRCSLTSRTKDQLPFAGRYRPTADVTEVLQRAAADRRPGVVLWEELDDLDESAEPPQRAPALFPVWVATLS